MRYLILSLIGFLTDYGTKRAVERTRKEGEETPLFSGRLAVHRLSNDGLAGGRLRGKKTLILSLTSAVSLITVIRFLASLPKKGGALLKTGLAFLSAGALGNLNDRWTRGAVTDFLRLRSGKKRLDRLVFNLADIMIALGGILTIFGSFRRGEK